MKEKGVCGTFGIRRKGRTVFTMFDRKAYEKRMEWFNEARFGMFIHWGIYAIPARGEWVRFYETITDEDYQPYFDEFDPVDYDPREWAKLAKAAGMKYAILTAKHHDGFCLFDSAYTDYKSTNTKCGRDLVREYVEAFRAEGLRVGLYYSLLDWHHPDFPHCSDGSHPMHGNPEYSDENRDFDRYLDYMHAQVRELCTNYGKIDIMWFDYSYGDMCGEKWRATELVKMARSLQPDIILDNRLEASGGGYGSIATENPSAYSGDYVCPEQIIPPSGIKDESGRLIPWEACFTMNDHWGYCSTDKKFKSPQLLIKKLVECVSKGGNMLLNVGPDARGRIPAESVSILKEIGAWMAKNGESIYGCTLSELPKPENGRLTVNGKNLYYHVMEPAISSIPLYGLRKEDVKTMRLLSDGSELPFSKSWEVHQYPDMVFVKPSETTELPDPVDTVVKVILK